MLTIQNSQRQTTKERAYFSSLLSFRSNYQVEQEYKLNITVNHTATTKAAAETAKATLRPTPENRPNNHGIAIFNKVPELRR